MRLSYLAAFTLLTLSAQPFPVGAALLQRSGNALKSYSTFEYTEVMSGGPAGKSCRAFWTVGAKQLDARAAAVRSGTMPSYGANLDY